MNRYTDYEVGAMILENIRHSVDKLHVVVGKIGPDSPGELETAQNTQIMINVHSTKR